MVLPGQEENTVDMCTLLCQETIAQRSNDVFVAWQSQFLNTFWQLALLFGVLWFIEATPRVKNKVVKWEESTGIKIRVSLLMAGMVFNLAYYLVLRHGIGL